jgi:protein required for attachment to host cells
MPNRKPYIRLPHRAVVFVGDGRKALFLLNEGTGIEPRLKVRQVLEDENPPTHEQGSDRPGRALSGSEPNRSAMEQTDWHDIEKHRFARAVTSALDRLVEELQAERVVIVAPPRTLADLRRSFSPAVEKLIVAEIAKDLTGLTASDISQHLTAAQS